MRYKSLAAVFLILMSVAISLCGCNKTTRKRGSMLNIVATTSMIADAVRTIAGDKVHLVALMGPGVDPHSYKPTKGDMDRLGEADIVFFNGLFLEAKMAEMLKKMGRSRATVAAGEAIPDSLRCYPSEFEGHPDPHVWFDMSLWQRVVDTIGTVLELRDKTNAEWYRTNRSAFIDSLNELHNWVGSQVGLIDSAHRVLVTAHDAFGYFGRAYDIEVEGLQGISTVTEAGLYDVTKMVDMIVSRRIKAVFVESSVPRKSIEAVVEGCRSQGHDVVIGGELYSDAMGEPGTEEGTYFGMVRHNVRTIVEALR